MSKYKVGDKVVLTVTGAEEAVCHPYYVLNDNNFNILVSSTDKCAEPLSTYTEPLEAKIKRQAAEITRLLAENEKLKAESGNVIWEIEQAFDRGCNEAWELARKIVLPQSQGGMNDEDYMKVFGSGVSAPYIMNNYTYPEAAAKVAEWEKAKEEIKVGDVYRSEVGNYFAIRTTDGEKGVAKILFMSNGEITPDYIKSYCTKTGRHIDIDSFLKQIGGNENER